MRRHLPQGSRLLRLSPPNAGAALPGRCQRPGGWRRPLTFSVPPSPASSDRSPRRSPSPSGTAPRSAHPAPPSTSGCARRPPPAGSCGLRLRPPRPPRRPPRRAGLRPGRLRLRPPARSHRPPTRRSRAAPAPARRGGEGAGPAPLAVPGPGGGHPPLRRRQRRLPAPPRAEPLVLLRVFRSPGHVPRRGAGGQARARLRQAWARARDAPPRHRMRVRGDGPPRRPPPRGLGGGRHPLPEGVTYYFCSWRCATVFAGDPHLYAVPASGAFYPTPGGVGSASLGSTGSEEHT